MLRCRPLSYCSKKGATYPVWICIGIPRCVATSRARTKMKSTRAFFDTRTGLPIPVNNPRTKDDQASTQGFSRTNCSSNNPSNTVPFVNPSLTLNDRAITLHFLELFKNMPRNFLLHCKTIYYAI
jgi:hypothetical protein